LQGLQVLDQGGNALGIVGLTQRPPFGPGSQIEMGLGDVDTHEEFRSIHSGVHRRKSLAYPSLENAVVSTERLYGFSPGKGEVRRPKLSHDLPDPGVNGLPHRTLIVQAFMDLR